MSAHLNLKVLTERPGNCLLEAELVNTGSDTLSEWELRFTFDKYIHPETVTAGHITQVGSYCRYQTDTGLTLATGEHVTFQFSVRAEPFRYHSHGVSDAVLVANSRHYPVVTSPLLLLHTNSPGCDTEIVEASQFPVIPRPSKLTTLSGQFRLDSVISLSVESEAAQPAADWLSEEIRPYSSLVNSGESRAKILLLDNARLEKESYRLEITPQQLVIEASDPTGFLHGCATLLQLVADAGNQSIAELPCLSIEDAPRYGYRGVMLDSVRHFQTPEQIRKLINQLAYYKLNTLHWHLTDDEGWRIEIKAFPQLTEIGAWRGPDQVLEPQYSHVNEKYGGYYSQAEIRAIIDYAEARGITIIPEIDMPGHCRAAIQSLPELLVDPDDQSNYLSIQNYNDNVLNPALDGTYHFIDKVLEEVASLFPSPCIHIGGDEVPEGVWKSSNKCLELMNRQGYYDLKELQGHLLRYAERKLHNLDKRMLGWEEAVQGDKVSSNTVIFSWLSEEAALSSADKGFDVVLQPGQFMYLDMVQSPDASEPGVDWANPLPLKKVYHYEPLALLSDSDPLRQRILGVQCAVWCEHITSPERLEYMLFPRLLAAAEVAWSEKENRNWQEFLSRLKGHLPQLRSKGIHYRDPWSHSNNQIHLTNGSASNPACKED